MVQSIKKQTVPNVRTSGWELQDFDINKIITSLRLETSLSPDQIERVINTVYERILNTPRLNNTFLSGPAIREMCCSILGELGYIEARKDYTRLGIPVFDYQTILTDGLRNNTNQTYNPESIHYWIADKIAEQYALLKLLPSHLADLHLHGDIHIGKLRFFDLRPFCGSWDLRMILYHGLPPGGSSHFANSGPANHPSVAFLHAAKWYGIVQGYFQGGQGYDNTCTFLAPYVRGLPEKEIEQLAQCLLFETNQIYAARAQVPFTSLDTEPHITKSLEDLPAISLGGKIQGVYGDYQDEAYKLFIAFSKAYEKGDHYGRVFNFPKHEVKIRKQDVDKYHDAYLQIHKEAASKGSPYFLCHPDWLPDSIHSQCCRLIIEEGKIKKWCKDQEKFDWSKSYMNMGSLQTVCINLPRIALLSRQNDDDFFDLLRRRMLETIQILLIKKEIMKELLDNRRLELLNNEISFPGSDTKQKLFDLDKFSLTVGFVGCNEMSKIHTNYELHEDETAMKFTEKTLRLMSAICEEQSVMNEYQIAMWEQPAEAASGRFAKLDYKYYKNTIVQGKIGTNTMYYTNSNHLRYDATKDGSPLSLGDIIEKQARFHPIVQGGVITHIWLGEAYPNITSLFNLTKRILETPTAYFAYSPVFTQCNACKAFLRGEKTSCPICRSTDLEVLDRVTGYYGRRKTMPLHIADQQQHRNRHDIL